jgi:phage terminase large subunit-like protein
LETIKSGAQNVMNCLTNLNAASLALLPQAKRRELLEILTLEQLEILLSDWRFWARESQLPPMGKWRIWLFLGGRGAGKTRAASEFICEAVECNQATNIALIGPSFQDVRDIMVEGHSGILNVAQKDFMPIFEPSNRRVIWPNGAKALLFSAEVPDSLRGPQFDLAWGDEFAAWADGDLVLDILRPALRLGENPQMVLTTTPRPVPWVKRLFKDKNCVITRSSSHENAVNLADGIIQEMEARWENSIWLRQELLGEIIDDPQGALWNRQDIQNARNLAREFSDNIEFEKIIIAVDPPATKGENADSCGIIVAGLYNSKAFIIADLTTQGQAPEEWARNIGNAYHEFAANYILAEANQGGEMVRTIIAIHTPDAMVKLTHARKSKRVRAEPIALLYAQNRIGHISHFPALEDEMCSFGTKDFKKSPDRVDALVWALSELLLGMPNPRARQI